MAGYESQLWKWLSPLLPGDGHFCRVESGDTSPGIPDVYYQLNSSSGWIELKVDRHPRSQLPFKRGGLRDDQVDWIDAELKYSGRTWIIARLEGPKEVVVIWGGHARNFNYYSRTALRDQAVIRVSLPLTAKRRAHFRRKLHALLLDRLP